MSETRIRAQRGSGSDSIRVDSLDGFEPAYTFVIGPRIGGSTRLSVVDGLGFGVLGW